MVNIFKAYDIRGIYNKDLTNKDAYLIGYYFVKYTKIDKLKVSSDYRLSSDILCKFFIKGVLTANASVIYQGKSSTPNFYYSLFEGVNSGVMITASHNPKEYNGFKFILNSVSFDSRNGLYELEKVITGDKDNINNNFVNIEKELENLELTDFLNKYNVKIDSKLESYINFLNEKYNSILNEKEKKILKKIKICFDYSSGVSSLAVIPFLKNTNLNYINTNETPDGNFPIHSPDPSKASNHLKTINDTNIDFSIVFDGDGDRIMLYDKLKEKILPDYLIAILVDYFSNLDKNFVVDLRVSRVIENICKKKNANLKLLRVGRSFYQDFMKENNCIFGGELSGHLFFREFEYLDNPDIAIIYILKIIAQDILNNNDDNNKQEFSINKLTNKYKTYYKIEETNLIVNNSNRALESIKEKYKDFLTLTIDGYSFDLKDIWFNIRMSNTEPKIRINFEGINEENTILKFNELVKFIKKNNF